MTSLGSRDGPKLHTVHEWVDPTGHDLLNVALNLITDIDRLREAGAAIVFGDTEYEQAATAVRKAATSLASSSGSS